MANQTISELPNLLSSGVTPDDLLVIVNSGETKNIKTGDFLTYTNNNAYVNITYSELFNKVVNNQLIQNQLYRLTDYKSVNFLNGYQIAYLNANYDFSLPTDQNFTPRQIYTGETEVLLLQAISNSELSPIGYSETYPQDIIEYEPLTNKIGVLFNQPIQNGNILPNSQIISGFDLQWDSVNNEVYFDMPNTLYPVLYGQVLSLYAYFDDGLGDKYYQDGYFLTTQNITSPELGFTTNNPALQYSKQTSRILLKNNGLRVVLVDLTQLDVNNYQSGTLSVNTVYELGNAFGQITKRTDTLRNVTAPLDFRGRKFRRFEQDVFGNLLYSGQGDNFGPFGTTGSYEDFNVFENATNLNWTGLGFGFDSVGENDNNVFLGFVSDVKINNGFANNTMGVGNSGGNLSSTIMESSTIGDYFRYNTFAGGFKNNQIDSGFERNFGGFGFEANTIPRNFRNNTIGNFFQRNFFIVDTQYTDYLPAFHVYQNYTCTINRSPNGTRYLTYIDDGGVMTSGVAPDS